MAKRAMTETLKQATDAVASVVTKDQRRERVCAETEDRLSRANHASASRGVLGLCPGVIKTPVCIPERILFLPEERAATGSSMPAKTVMAGKDVRRVV